MFRRLQLSSKKLKELFDKREYENEEIVTYFGKQPLEFAHAIENPIPYANQFGTYGKQLTNVEQLYNKIPAEFKDMISMDDIGKWVDKQGREYIGGFKDGDYTVKIPFQPENRTIEFPELYDIIELQRRGQTVTVQVESVGNYRTATAALSTRKTQ